MRSPGKLLERAVRNAAPPIPLDQGRSGIGVIHSIMGRKGDPQGSMDLWKSVSPLNAGVNLLAEAFSMVHWHLYRTHDNRGRISGPDSRREVFVHQALKVWDQPNEIMSGQFFRQLMQLHLELTAHSFWVVSKIGSIPTEMWPISRRDVEPVPSSEADKAIAGYAYRAPNGQLIPLQTDEVVWLRTPDPADTFGGFASVEAMRTELASTRNTSEYKARFFENNAEPGGIWDLDMPPGVVLSDKEFGTISQRWAEQHRGVRAAHRVAIIERGKWTSTTNSLKDLQFTELRRDDRDSIYEGLGVSKSLLGVTEDVNRSNAETNEYVFSKYRTTLRLERCKYALNGPYLNLFPGTGEGVQFDYDSPIPEDWRAEAQALREKGQAAYYLVRAGATLKSVGATLGLDMLEESELGPLSPAADPGASEGVPADEPA